MVASSPASRSRAADGEPVDPGQHEVEQDEQVEQDEFDAGVTGALESLLAGVDDVDVEARVVQVGAGISAPSARPGSARGTAEGPMWRETGGCKRRLQAVDAAAGARPEPLAHGHPGGAG